MSYNINALWAKFFRGNQNICLLFRYFLHIDISHVVEILPQARQELTYFTVNTMGADVLTTQGAKAPATMILTMKNQINLIPAH